MAGTSHPLEEGGDRSRGPHLDHEIHVPHVDPQLERRRRHERPEPPLLQPPLGLQPMPPREAPVMARDVLLPQTLGQPGRQPLGHFARVDENDRGPMLPDELRHPRVDLLPGFVGTDGGKRGLRHFDRQIQFPEGAGVHEGARAVRPHEKPRHVLEGLLRGRKADPLNRPRQRLEPLQGERQVRPPLVPGQRMDLVHDRRAHRPQEPPPSLTRQKKVERFRRGHEDVRRLAGHPRALRRRGVPGPHQNPHGRQKGIVRHDLRQRPREIPLDVVTERPKRGNIENPRLVRKMGPLTDEPVDRPEKGGQRLARPGRRGDENMAPLADPRPSLPLRRGRRPEPRPEPPADRGVEGVQNHNPSAYAPAATG
jgi:hypothetical protein